MTRVARARLTRGQWPLVGLAALAVVTAILVMLAALKTWAPPDEALPGPVRGASTAPASTLSKPAPATADASRQDLNGVADIITSPRGGSILVVGDGSGDEMDEWVSVWARDHLAGQATVSYNAWTRISGRYADPVTFGSASRSLKVWNASVRTPDMAREPERVVRAWQEADVVLLSYGHRRSATEIPAQLDAVLEAVRAKSQTASVVVLIQNPDRARTEAIQQETTQAIKKWADAKGFPTVDIYSAFTGDPNPRDGMVEVDGSPTPQGSRLWAKTVADALAAPPAR